MARKKTPIIGGKDRLQIGRSVAPPEMYDEYQREEWGLPKDEGKPGDYMVELNLLHKRGLQEAELAFLDLYKKVVELSADPDPQYQPVRVSKTYYKCRISVQQWKA